VAGWLCSTAARRHFGGPLQAHYRQNLAVGDSSSRAARYAHSRLSVNVLEMDGALQAFKKAPGAGGDDYDAPEDESEDEDDHRHTTVGVVDFRL